MAILGQSTIREIAKEIASGNTCYVHRSTRKITTIDASLEGIENISAKAEVLALIEKKSGEYVKIEKLSTQEQLVIMRDFMDELPDRAVRKQIANALSRKNPIRNFEQSVGGDTELSQHWENFNFEEYQTWVSNLIYDEHKF